MSFFRRDSSALAILTLAILMTARSALAEDTPQQGGPKFNATLFHDAAISGVTAVTSVSGRGQNLTAVIVELAGVVDPASVSSETFSVDSRNILSVRVTDTPDADAPSGPGRYVVINLDPADPTAAVFAPGLDEAAQAVVHLNGTLSLADGTTLTPGEKGIISTRTENLIVDEFQQFRFTDPETGLALTYNLFIPRNYDVGQSYPLVLFMHDAGVTGSNPLRTLEQGLGAVSFASPEDQARHPAFVLAPQFPVVLTNDASQTSVYVGMIPRLLKDLSRNYALDPERIYATGQSGGCMTSIALGVAHPDLFAGTLCVAGQWDPAVTAPLAGSNFWAVISQDDAKAYPGMTAIMDVLQANGATVTRGTLDAKAPAQDTAAAIAAIRAEGEATGSHIYFTTFSKGSVLPPGDDSPGAGHVNTWVHAYDIPALRDWLLDQRH